MSKSQYQWTIFSIIATGSFLGMLDSSTVNVALYKIFESFSAKLEDVQWVITAYMLVLTILLPLFGRLCDNFSKKKLFTLGFIFFALGSFLNTTAISLPFLIGFRCVEAIGASILLSNSTAIVASIFKNKKRGKALGILGGIIALGGMTGPAVGGILINFFSWRAVFVPAIPIALLGAYFSYRLIPDNCIETKFKFDTLGFFSFAVFMTSMLVFTTKAQIWGIGSLNTIVTFLLFIVFAILFFIIENRAKCPLVKFELFKNKSFALGNIALSLSYMGLFANGVLFPLYFQEILKLTPLQVGLFCLPFSIALVSTAPIAGNLAGKYGSRVLTTLGPISVSIGLLIFTTFKFEANFALIILAQALIGMGNGLFQSPTNTAIMNTATKENRGSASGILALFRNAGMIIAVSMAISIFDTLLKIFTKNNIDYQFSYIKAYHITLYIGILFSLVCSVISNFAYRKK